MCEKYKISEVGEQLIKHYENLRLKAYQDKGGIWTIGWGNTYYDNGIRVKRGDLITKGEADKLFEVILNGVNKSLNSFFLPQNKLEQNNFDALASFYYNVGIDQFRNSTLYRIVKSNPKEYALIDEQFMRWKYDNGKVIEGLENRRKSESLLYREDKLVFFN